MLVKQIAFQNIKDFSRESKCAEGRRFCGVFLWGFSLDKEFEKPSDIKKFVPYGIGNASEPNASVYDSIFKVLALWPAVIYPYSTSWGQMTKALIPLTLVKYGRNTGSSCSEPIKVKKNG
jgi:hypothetical protein